MANTFWSDEWPTEPGYYWFVGKPTTGSSFGSYIIQVAFSPIDNITTPIYHVMDTSVTIFSKGYRGYGLFYPMDEPTIKPYQIEDLINHFRENN